MTIPIDPGSTEYLFVADYERIAESFRTAFPDSNTDLVVRCHSDLAGTMIDIFVNAASMGGGIIAAELLKEASKDIWKAIKGGQLTPDQ